MSYCKAIQTVYCYFTQASYLYPYLDCVHSSKAFLNHFKKSEPRLCFFQSDTQTIRRRSGVYLISAPFTNVLADLLIYLNMYILMALN